jgi:hypothetical protein
MTLDGRLSFAQVIEEHLELKRRNSALESEMPLARYLSNDPFGNHPLFKSEEQARLEDTATGREPVIDDDLVLAWPAEETQAMETVDEDTLWGRSRDFDWGD